MVAPWLLSALQFIADLQFIYLLKQLIAHLVANELHPLNRLVVA